MEFRMSGIFSGFTETDIKSVQSGLSVDKPVDNGKHVQASFTPKKKLVRPMVRFQETENKIDIARKVTDIPEEAKLSKTHEIKLSKNDETNLSKDDIAQVNTTDAAVESKSSTDESADNKSIETNTAEKVDLDELQTRQKVIEEQNRMRKELILRALADKRKRTEEETRRLNDVQNEFKKLDTLLSNDVKVLRQQIEIASIDYMQMQKRYMRIEKAFLHAKLALHKKSERKELLTEHLCKIIEQNEERKAEKLTELLNKLQIADVQENEEPNEAAE